MANTWIISPTWTQSVLETAHGKLPYNDDSSIADDDRSEWRGFNDIIAKSVTAGKTFSTNIISTYSLVYTAANAYVGGVLAPNGDIHFVPYSANRGQKISAAGVVSTYSLVYTTTTAYAGGVLAPNGDIHFVPTSATIGQKININSGIDFPIGVCLHPFYNKL